MLNTQDLPRLPFPIPDLTDIPPGYRQLQAEQPISRVRTATGDMAWLVTRYREVKILFGDERLGRTHPDPERAARTSDSVLGAPVGSYETELEDHQRMRKLLAPAFSARRMQALQPRVEQYTGELLDRIATLQRPADLHRELSYPLPVMVICELLGVPRTDHDKVQAWSRLLNDRSDSERSGAALGDLMEYMFELIEDRKHTPATDVISDMVAEEPNWGRIALATALLLYAGHETTATRIDFGTLLLLVDRARWDAIQHDPTLIPTAVEEILRFAATGANMVTRYARTDIDVAGVRIREGDAVLLNAGIANRDGRAFADPDRFDVTRQANPHVAFGHGPFFCIGASLARIELQAVFSALTRRFPTLRLAVPQDELRLRGEAVTGGLTALPVTW